MAVNGGGRLPLVLVGQGADVRFYLRQIASRAGPWLVLGAANGRIAWELAARGGPVVAVDPSPVMVQSAEERRAGEPVEVSGRLSLRCEDLRTLRLPERFEAVLAPQNALGLMGSLAELDALLATVRHHLKDGGLFAFDVLNRVGQGVVAPPEVEPGAPLEPPRVAFLPHLRERRRSPASQEMSGLRRLKLRQFHPDELDGALARAGLVALERYGDFDGKPFEPEDSLQVVVGGPA